MAEDELPLDVVEQILISLDVKDLLRYKSVCKSWQSLISTPRFVKSHLNHSYINDRHCQKFGHRRIQSPVVSIEDYDYHHIVGSCNGLVCVSPGDSVEFLVTNPSTREVKKLARPVPPQHMPKNSLDKLSGFGYDSAIDDYKVVVCFRTGISTMQFQVLTLKSNTWKLTGEAVNGKYFFQRRGTFGIFCDGALHWFMKKEYFKYVIISFHLSTHEFKEIPLTADEPDLYVDTMLGTIEECLCLYRSWYPISGDKWVMRNNKWEVYNHNCSESSNTDDVLHRLTRLSRAVDYTTSQTTGYVYGRDDGRLMPGLLDNCIFVKSLVSPHPHPRVNTDNHNYAMQQGQGE